MIKGDPAFVIGLALSLMYDLVTVVELVIMLLERALRGLGG